MTDDTMPCLDTLLKRGGDDFMKELAEEVLGGLRVLPDRIMAIGKCMAMPRSYHEQVLALINDILDEMKSLGTTHAVLEQNGQRKALMTPPAKAGA